MLAPRDDSQLEAVQSAWLRYIVLLVGIGLVLVTTLWVVWPWPYYRAVERFLLPQYEDRLGFRGGRIKVTWDHDSSTVYGFESVRPGGVMERAGVEAGDIPVEYHDGVGAFYNALQKFDSGDHGEFDVLSKSDWEDWRKRRRIVLVPETSQSPSVY